ncbi:hypothetical protein [Amycolatopsis pigmentata]|uniref:Uncharacterized protein n=1 Tax=Amycolatopsis pigmentata TaxID=450801 RepID=A0ABW5FVT4_9PSEU
MTNPFGYPVERGRKPAGIERTPNGATAILAGLVGLALAGILGYLPVTQFIYYGISDQPDRTLIVLGLYLGAALLLLLGAVVTFFRVLAGGILLLIGALVAMAAVVAESTLLQPGRFTEFFRAMFQFIPDDAFVRVAATVGGPLVFLLAVLPSTFRYLRDRPPEIGYGPPPGYPPRGW